MTRDELTRLFDGLSVRSTHVVVHASLSSFGNVEGGAATVCVALLDAVGDAGTIVIPAFTYAETLSGGATGGPAESDAAASSTAASSTALGRVPPVRRPVAFHPELPVSREIGAIAEAFRHVPGVMRSSHPTHSFAAWGLQAREVLSTQRDNNPLGPLKKLNVLQGQVLLLGTTLQSVTAIHLAEERLSLSPRGRRTAVRLNAAGYEERVVLENLPGCSAAFIKLEGQLDPAKVRSAPLARGTARKIPIRYLVQLATAVLESDPQAFVCEQPGCESCAAKRDALTHAPRRPSGQ